MADFEGENRRQILVSRVAQSAMELCCGAFQVSMHEMTLAARSRAPVAYARQVAMYLAHVVGQLSIGEVCTAFGRDRSTVSHACHTIEDRRDGPVFERELEGMEQAYRYEISRLCSELAAGAVEAAPAGKGRPLVRRRRSKPRPSRSR